MAANDPMTIDERRKYLFGMQKRYRGATRQERAGLLDEMAKVTHLHRKSLIRLMRGDVARKRRRKQRGRSYPREVDLALKVIAESLDHLCAERLQPNLVWMASHLARHAELEISPTTLAQLGTISVSSVRRSLQRLAHDEPRLPRRRPRPVNPATRGIPAGRIPWQEHEPGHFETDLVHHCGLSTSGQYLHTLQMIDVATGWSERVAVLGRSYLVMQDGFLRILARLPFPVLEIHPDNGGEFLNNHLLTFWSRQSPPPLLSRSRPWQKNDNRFVEQKNDTLVRAYVGYDRFDTVDQTRLLNQLYDRMWWYFNFFQPVMRLAEKTVLPAERGPGKIRRRFDRAQTPFDRLCATGRLPEQRSRQLHAQRDAINPRQLREQIYALLAKLMALPCASPVLSQDVYKTLFQPTKPRKGQPVPVTLSFDRTMSPR
jgi:hypothetical protein